MTVPRTMATDRRNANAPVPKVARKKGSPKVTDLEDANERAEEAETMAKISADKASALQSKLTEQIAFTAARDAKLAELEAKLNAAKKAAAEAVATRESSDGDSGGASGDGSGKILPSGLKAYLTHHVTAIFRNIKFLNEDTLHAIPKIMTDTYKAMNMTNRLEQEKYKIAIKKEMKYLMSQRRAYCKKQIMGRYKSK